MNTPSTNKQVALRFFDAIRKGDVQGMGDLMTDDAVWWVSPTTKNSGTHQKKDFLELVPRLFAQADGPFELAIDDVTAEDNRVSVTAKGNVKLKSGKTYANEYHFLFKFKDGKISMGKEYSDSAHVNDVLGEL